MFGVRMQDKQASNYVWCKDAGGGEMHPSSGKTETNCTVELK